MKRSFLVVTTTTALLLCTACEGDGLPSYDGGSYLPEGWTLSSTATLDAGVPPVTVSDAAISNDAAVASDDAAAQPDAGQPQVSVDAGSAVDAGTTPQPDAGQPTQTPADTTACGQAAENADATLTCPAGQAIQSVAFASYGTPTGSCGSFAQGDCHADTSLQQVQNTCAGESSCTVNANNELFGDPCSGVGKQLSVEVVCSAAAGGDDD